MTLDKTCYLSECRFAQKVQLTFDSGYLHTCACWEALPRAPPSVPCLFPTVPLSLPLGQRREAALERVLWGPEKQGGWAFPGGHPVSLSRSVHLVVNSEEDFLL